MIVQSGVIDSCSFGGKKQSFSELLISKPFDLDFAPRTGLKNERSELGNAQQYHSDIMQHSPKAKLTVVCVANNEC